MDLEPIIDALGAEPRDVRSVGGGDICQAHRVALDDDRVVFVKSRHDPPPDFFRLEADGLTALAAADAIRVPKVFAVGPTFLALEWIERTSSVDAEQLGRQLAELHRHGHESFGLDHDNYVGVVPQDNSPCSSWPEFYATRRLEPLVRRNVASGTLPRETDADLARLASRLDDLCGPGEPPALLHGDLWSGNQMATSGGQPVLIDPAVHYGHREVDLAMMRLFGGFAPSTFAAYDEQHPLADGHGERVRLYQLHPLLVHVTMFGGGYVRSFLDALHSYL